MLRGMAVLRLGTRLVVDQCPWKCSVDDWARHVRERRAIKSSGTSYFSHSGIRWSGVV